MLDWIRINHPQTPINSRFTKPEVAKLVREMQPDCQYYFLKQSPHKLLITILMYQNVTQPVLEQFFPILGTKHRSLIQLLAFALPEPLTAQTDPTITFCRL